MGGSSLSNYARDHSWCAPHPFAEVHIGRTPLRRQEILQPANPSDGDVFASTFVEYIIRCPNLKRPLAMIAGVVFMRARARREGDDG